MSSRKISAATQILDDTRLIAGLAKHKGKLPPTLNLGGRDVTPDQLATMLQARIDAANAVPPGKAAYLKAVTARNDLHDATDELVRDLKTTLVLSNKRSPDVLADYGLAVTKPAVRTTAEKVVAVALRKATRVMRGTRGPKQKKAIKARLVGPLVVDPLVQ